MRATAFKFVEPGPLVDGGLELVAPAVEWLDDLLAAQHHPLSLAESPHLQDTTRDYLLDFLSQHPAGRTLPDPVNDRVPSYHFWIRLRPGGEFGPRPPLAIAGGIGLRLGSTWEIEQVAGHIGYNVYPAARGRHLAERSCRLLLPLARRYGFQTLWITCNPDNHPSRRTCERLGAQLIEVIPVPKDHPLYARGDHEKCRYRLDL